MLEGLDLIDWSKLKHAYGAATDVPGLLRDLASDDRGVRDAAMYELCGNIHHQSDVYEASAYAVPFLVELLTSPKVQDKSSILALLEALANGYSYLSRYDDPDVFGSYYEYRYAPEQLEINRQRRRAWTEASHQAVLEHVLIYLHMLADEDVSVRAMAVFVLSTCFERAAEITPYLQRQLVIETDPVAHASMVMGLHRLWKLTKQWAVDQPLVHEELKKFLCDLLDRLDIPLLSRFVIMLALVDLGDLLMRNRLLIAFAEDGEQCIDEFSHLRLQWDEDASLVGAISTAYADEPALQQQWLIELLSHPNATVRRDVIDAVAEVCYRRRAAPAVFAPHLVQLVTDSDETVRKFVAWFLLDLGKACLQLIAPLQTLCQHPDSIIAHSTQELLQQIEKRNHLLEQTILKQWPPRQSLQDKNLAELIKVVEQGIDRANGQLYDCQSALVALGKLGAAARGALPLIDKALNHPSPDICVWGAYALWKIDQNVENTLPVLLDAIHRRLWPWATLMAVETLGEMGRYAQKALAKLHEFVYAEVRPRDVTVLPIIDGDEWLQLVAQQAIMHIEDDIALNER